MEGNGEGSAALLLYAAAINYACWQQAYSAGFKAFTVDELDQAVRAGDEARAQLRERARAYVLTPGRTIGEPEDFDS